MGEIDRKSIGTLMDELITTRLKLFLDGKDVDLPDHLIDEFDFIDNLVKVNMQIFFALEDANRLAEEEDHIGVGQAYGKAQRLNSRRSALITAIDERLGEGHITAGEKTF